MVLFKMFCELQILHRDSSLFTLLFLDVMKYVKVLVRSPLQAQKYTLFQGSKKLILWISGPRFNFNYISLYFKLHFKIFAIIVLLERIPIWYPMLCFKIELDKLKYWKWVMLCNTCPYVNNYIDICMTFVFSSREN